MAWVLGGAHEVALLDPATGTLRRIALPHAPRQTHLEPGGRGLMILDDAGATWVPVGSGGAGRQRRFDLDGVYGRVTFGPDARRAVLHHGGAGEGARLDNPNQIAVLDLSDGTAVERTLRSYGSAPQQIVVAPRGDLAGADRQLAWMLAERYLAVLDLAAPEAREVVVHLTLATDTREVTPIQVVVGRVDGNQTAFVRAAGADDLFSLTFPEAAAADEVPRPFLNQLPAGQRPGDLTVLEVHEGVRVFTADAGSQTLSIIHPVTGRRTAVPVNLPVERLVPFKAPREDLLDGQAEGASGQFALLWSPGSNAVIFADLDLVERRAGRALTPLVLTAAVTAVHPLPGRRGAVAELGPNAVALLDFEARTATPLTTDGQLRDLRVDPDGAAFHVGVFEQGEFAVVTVDTTTGAAADTVIPAGAGQVLLVPEADRLVVAHDRLWGRVSVVNGEAVRELDGLLLEGILDR